jgi:hypothetical protein
MKASTHRKAAEVLRNLRRKVVKAWNEFEDESSVSGLTLQLKPKKFLDRLASMAARADDMADEEEVGE